MFSSTAKCPVDAQTQEWIERRMAWLKNQFNDKSLLIRPVILPNSESFPDPYDGSEPAVRVLFDRVCGYMGVRVDEVEVSLYWEEVPIQEGELVPGTGGLYRETDGRFHIWLNGSNLDDPGGLIATMAHELGHVLLLGQGRISSDEPDHEPLTDLLTVFFGLGIITANAVVHDKSWFSGGWSGWEIGRRGYISMPMYGYALALFAKERGEDRPQWARHLRPDVRKAFEQGRKWLAEGVPPLNRDRSTVPVTISDVGTAVRHGQPDITPEANLNSAPSEAISCCDYCGTAVLDCDDDEVICTACRESVEANCRQLESERRPNTLGYRYLIRAYKMFFLAVIAVIAAMILWKNIK